MRQLIRQEVGGITLRQGTHKCLVGLDDPERRLIILEGKWEGHGGRLVGGTENHEHVGRHPPDSFVGPGETWPPTAWVDVWRENSPDCPVDRMCSSRPRPRRIGEIPGELCV